MGGCPLHTRHCNLLTPKKKEGVGVGDEGGTLCPMNHYTLMNLRLIQLNHPTPPMVSWLTKSTLVLLPGQEGGTEFKRRSVKYTAQKLFEKGVLLEIEGLPNHQ